MFDNQKIRAVADTYREMLEGKKYKREAWVPEAIADEDVADFMGAAAAAAKDGKKEFKFGDKTYKVTMKKDTVDAITDEKDVAVCEKCGKVHEGSCGSVKEEAEDLEEVTKDTDELEPRAKGEKDFKKMHDDNVEKKDEDDDEDENVKNMTKDVKKSKAN